MACLCCSAEMIVKCQPSGTMKCMKFRMTASIRLSYRGSIMTAILFGFCSSLWGSGNKWGGGFWRISSLAFKRIDSYNLMERR